MSLTVDEVKGLSTLPEDDLTVEEAIEISQKLEEEKDKEAQEESEMSLIVKTLAMLEDAPTEADIENWKSQYGTIHISTILNGSDLYLWRTLRRQEYKQLMKSGFLNEVLRGEEAIVKKCLLYPKPDEKFMATSNAGVVSSLKEQIMYKSSFVPESIALSQIKVI